MLGKHSKDGIVLQGYFRIEQFRGGVAQAKADEFWRGRAPRPELMSAQAGRNGAAQAKAGAVSRAGVPRPDLLPAAMRGTPAQAKAASTPSLWPGAPRPELLPGMGKLAGVFGQAAQLQAQGGVVSTPLSDGRLRLIGPGKPLEPGILAHMENFFNADFSRVRVHEGPAAQAMGALAFTLGETLYFTPGLYDTSTREGIQLLGHELTHVVQQRDGRVSNPYGGGVAIVQDPALEAEADALGKRVADELWLDRGQTAQRRSKPPSTSRHRSAAPPPSAMNTGQKKPGNASTVQCFGPLSDKGTGLPTGELGLKFPVIGYNRMVRDTRRKSNEPHRARMGRLNVMKAALEAIIERIPKFLGKVSSQRLHELKIEARKNLHSVNLELKSELLKSKQLEPRLSDVESSLVGAGHSLFDYLGDKDAWNLSRVSRFFRYDAQQHYLQAPRYDSKYAFNLATGGRLLIEAPSSKYSGPNDKGAPHASSAYKWYQSALTGSGPVFLGALDDYMPLRDWSKYVADESESLHAETNANYLMAWPWSLLVNAALVTGAIHGRRPIVGGSDPSKEDSLFKQQKDLVGKPFALTVYARELAQAILEAGYEIDPNAKLNYPKPSLSGGLVLVPPKKSRGPATIYDVDYLDSVFGTSEGAKKLFNALGVSGAYNKIVFDVGLMTQIDEAQKDNAKRYKILRAALKNLTKMVRHTSETTEVMKTIYPNGPRSLPSIPTWQLDKFEEYVRQASGEKPSKAQYVFIGGRTVLKPEGWDERILDPEDPDF